MSQNGIDIRLSYFTNDMYNFEYSIKNNNHTHDKPGDKNQNTHFTLLCHIYVTFL